MTENSGSDSILGGEAADVNSGLDTSSQVAADATGAGEAAVEAPQIAFPENWKEGLGEFANDPGLSTIMDVPGLAKAYVNLQKQFGSDKFTVPSKHATPDDWKEVFHKLGHPASLEEYDVQPPEGAQFNDGFITEFKKRAFELNILPQQAKDLLNWYDEANQQALKQQEDQYVHEREATIKELKQEWGQAFEQKINLAKHVLKSHGDPDVFSFLEETGLGDDKRLIKLLANIGAATHGEDTIVGNPADTFARTPGEVQEEINTIMANQEHPYWNPGHPNHGSAVKEMERLMSQAHPQEQR